MKEYLSKLGDDGRVVIPATLRKALHLTAGNTLIFKLINHELHVTSSEYALVKAQKKIKKLTQGKSLVDNLMQMRKEERSND